MDSIFFTHSETFVRLENICPHTDTWLQDEDFVMGGKPVKRKKGDKVPKNLLRALRDLRKTNPELFEKGTRWWGSPNAYQNQVTCAAHSELMTEECPDGCLHLVDMFGGELGEIMEGLNFLRHQPKAIVPAKQTAKSQVTDLGFAKWGKGRCSKEKLSLRRLKRRKAQDAGVSAKLAAATFEMVYLANCMHDECVQKAQEGAVEKSFCRGAWCAFDFHETRGMEAAEGDRWEGLPLGGSNLSSNYMRHRFTGLNSAGKPERPDWGELHRLRVKQRKAARDDKEIKERGTKAWLQNQKENKAKLEKEQVQEEKDELLLSEER